MPRKWGAPVAALTLALSSVLIPVGLSPAAAVPGNPGVPSDPVLVFEEDFEFGLAETPIALLRDYVGAGGTTYTGTPFWTEPTMCNGIIVRNAAPAPAGCSVAGGATQIRQMANALGQLNGTADPALNHAVSAYTNSSTAEFPLAAGDIEFATETPIAISGGSRFLTFSVNSTVINCHAQDPVLRFALVDEGVEIPATNTPINVCTDPRAQVITVNGTDYLTGTFTSDGSVLFEGTELGIVMRNDTASSAGNDHAYDDIRVLDVTPQLDKSFEQPTAQENWIVGDQVPVTFTVTNTSELAEKDGWGFTDQLQDGLVIADVPPITTCDAGTVTAVPGATSFSVTDGLLSVGDISCSITVTVTATEAGEFSNGPDDIDATGLNEPLVSTIVVDQPAPALELTKTGELTTDDGDGIAELGEEITYTLVAENTGNIPLFDVVVEDPRLQEVAPATADIPFGGNAVFTGVYVVTQADIDAGGVFNVATASATDGYTDDLTTSNEAVEELPTPEREPGLELLKVAELDDANGNNLADVGETIVFTFEAENTGNVTLTDVSIDDPLVTSVTPDSVDLAPGEEAVFESAPYTVTADDQRAGKVENTAVAIATSPLGELSSNASTVTVPATLLQLAITGASAAAPLGAAVIALGAGAVLLLLRLRRRAV